MNMNLRPKDNTRLYGMKFFFNEIIGLYNNDKMPTKILLTGKKGLGKSTLAYHIVNYILSQKEEFNYDINNNEINENNKSFKLLKNNSHPNFYLVDLKEEKKTIDISQIREMISFTNKSSFNNLSKLILIDNIDYLNKNSINSLLKILEEPNKNIFFILIQNNKKYILPTLRSRCLNFKIFFTFEDSVKITNNIIKKDIFDLIDQNLINYYNTPGELISLINFSLDNKINLKNYTIKEFLNLLIENRYYKKDKLIKNLLISFIELFFLKEYKDTLTKNSLLNIYHSFLHKIHNIEKFNLDDESLFMEFKSKLLNG